MVDGYIPETLEEALRVRRSVETTVVAGGTDLMVRYRRYPGIAPRLPRPPLFVARLPELRGIRTVDAVTVIGAAARLSDIAVSQAAPACLREVIAWFASPAVRNSGTLGGNVCNASPAGDTIPVLYAADAELVLRSASGARTGPAADFIAGPGSTILTGEELLTEIRIPAFGAPWRFLYRKVGPRRANALSKLSVLVLWQVIGGRVRDFRAAVGGAAPTVARSPDAEQAAMRFLDGGTGRPGSMSEFLDALAAVISPIDDQRSTSAYRRRTVLRIAESFLWRIAESIEER